MTVKNCVSNIDTPLDANINILQYIRDSRISVHNEIEKIRSGRDINVVIEQFFFHAPDYRKFYDKIKEVEDRLQKIRPDDTEGRRLWSQKLAQLKALEKEFRIDVLYLAETFLQIKITSDRLTKARELFLAGRFKAADEMLSEEDLMSDQETLLAAANYLERKKDSIIRNYLS